MEEEELNEHVHEENEDALIAAALRQKQTHSLAQKRSFFVRMVSDPKCYNPKIVRTLSAGRRRLSEDLRRDLSLRYDIEEGAGVDEFDDLTSLPLSETGVQAPM